MVTRVHAPEDLLALTGRTMGETGWHEIDQRQVDTFADATWDHQWIHVDPERAKTGPFGGTVAHGFLTLSLIPRFLDETVTVETSRSVINYGLNKVRFPAAVPVGSSVRARIDLVDARKRATGVEATFAVATELRDSERPACVAEVVIVYS
jgi:acyl dehydratase